MEKVIKSKFLYLALSIVLVLFSWHNFNISGNNIIFLAMFIGFFLLNKETIENVKKRELIIALIVGFVFSICEILGNSLIIDDTLNNVVSRWLPINILGYWIIGTETLIIFFRVINYLKANNKKHAKISEYIDKHHKLFFVANIVLILMCYLPFFLRFFPGIITADSIVEIEQAIGASELQAHHPLIHIFFIEFCLTFGNAIFHDINAGIAIYSILQMIIMAVVFSIILEYFRRKNVPVLVRFIALLFFMIYIPNCMFSVTMWKDVLFGVWGLSFVVCTYELLTNTDEFFSKKRNLVLYVIVALLFMLGKKNGVYIVLPTLLLIFIMDVKRNWKRYLPVFGSIILIYYILTFVVFNIIKIPKSPAREMLSIPLQQMARTVNGHREEIDPQLLDELDKFFKKEKFEEEYTARVSDNVKILLNEDYYKENKGTFWKLWFKLLAKYPKQYIVAFLCNSFGYYFIETRYWVALENLDSNNFGIERNEIIEEYPFDNLYMENEINGYSRDLIIYDIGLFFWIDIFALSYFILEKRYREVLLFVPLALIWLTMIVSPVYAEFRYGYPLVLSLIVIFGISTLPKKRGLSLWTK